MVYVKNRIKIRVRIGLGLRQGFGLWDQIFLYTRSSQNRRDNVYGIQYNRQKTHDRDKKWEYQGMVYVKIRVRIRVQIGLCLRVG